MSRFEDHDLSDLDSELKALEAELSQLKPRKASPKLIQSVDRETQNRRFRALNWRWTAGSGMAAAAMLFVVLNVFNEHPKAPEPTHFNQAPSRAVRPVSSEGLWERTWDEGPVLIDNQYPVKRVLKQKMKTFKWFDKKRNIQIQIHFPEQKVEHKVMEIY